MTRSESDPPQRLPLWRYPGKWSREESFWREMTTRTLSALLAAGVIVLAGRSAGLFSQVPWTTIGRAFIAGSAWVGVSVAVVGLLSSVIAWRKTRESRRDFAYINQAVGRINNSLIAHEAKRREWETQYAELQRQHREAIEEAMREWQATQGISDDDLPEESAR